VVVGPALVVVGLAPPGEPHAASVTIASVANGRVGLHMRATITADSNARPV
jgi:hypothetical protein